MDPFELLKHDHETVSKLFKRIEAASGRVKLIRFRKLKTELELHTHIEEKIFYPALKNPEESRDITLEAYEEHKVVKDLLSQLDGARASDQWDGKFTVLKENVEHHVEEEEGELFSKAREVLSAEKLETLCVSGCVDGHGEFHFAWHAGHVSDLPAATAQIQPAADVGRDGVHDGRRNFRRASVRIFFG